MTIDAALLHGPTISHFELVDTLRVERNVSIQLLNGEGRVRPADLQQFQPTETRPTTSAEVEGLLERTAYETAAQDTHVHKLSSRIELARRNGERLTPFFFLTVKRRRPIAERSNGKAGSPFLLRWVKPDGTARPGSQGIPSVSVVATEIGTEPYFWGFIEFFDYDSYGFALGMIRMRRSTTEPHGYDQEQVQILSNGQWVYVDSDGTFDFVPDALWFGVAKPRVVYEGSQFYLWVSGSAPLNPDCATVPPPLPACYKPNPVDDTDFGNTILYLVVDPNSTSLNNPIEEAEEVKANVIPPPQGEKFVRCMPGGYNDSRTFPMPIAGNGLLYSSMADEYCVPGNNYQGASVVVTAIK